MKAFQTAEGADKFARYVLKFEPEDYMVRFSDADACYYLCYRWQHGSWTVLSNASARKAVRS